MIIAIEGPSAAGKTTWCRTHCPNAWVEELPYHIAAPDLYADPAEVARFWVHYNSENWRRALELERKHGVAVCDGDPYHLYFAWSLWKSGALDASLFQLERALYQEAFQQRQMGWADVVLWLEAPAEELRRRAQGDTVRKRKRHEIYLELVPWMKTWFAARESIFPGTVQVLHEGLRVEDLDPKAEEHRYDTRLLGRMLALL